MNAVTDESLDAPALLTKAATEFGDRVVLTTAIDLEGSVLAHMVAVSGLPVRLVTLDTGLLFPEAYETWRRLEADLSIEIEAVHPLMDLETQAAQHGPTLWRTRPDECCRIRKIEPLERVLASAEAWVTGIRRAQTPQRANAPKVGYEPRFGVIKINPLADWALADVQDYLREHDIPYNPMFERGYPSIGCAPCTRAVSAGEDARAGRWTGFDKQECGLHFETAADGTVTLKRETRS